VRGDLDGDSVVGKTEQAAWWTKREFGVWAAKYFDDLGTLSFVWGMTNNLVNDLDDTDTKKFYYELKHGSDQYYWYDDKHAGIAWDTVEGAGNDTVDFVFATTHGDYTSDYAKWALRPQNYWVNSSSMRLGDDGHNSILAVYSVTSARTGS
jgi:hypothetical protein